MKTEQVERKLANAMTVRQLIKALADEDPDAYVLFTCDYGDHCHTQQALPVKVVEDMQPDTERIEESAYSQSGLALAELDDEDDELEDYDGPAVVILR